MENGKVVEDIGLIENPEWKNGLQDSFQKVMSLQTGEV